MSVETREQLEQALLGFSDRLDKLGERLDSLGDKAEFDRRAEALRAAREHVSGLPSEQANSRGYRDHSLRPEDRIALELRVARYLLEDGE